MCVLGGDVYAVTMEAERRDTYLGTRHTGGHEPPNVDIKN